LLRTVIAAGSALVLFVWMAQAHADIPRHQAHAAESRKPHDAISHSPHAAGSHPKPQKAPKHETARKGTHPKVAKH
jgi:hypothetical protein